MGWEWDGVFDGWEVGGVSLRVVILGGDGVRWELGWDGMFCMWC